MADVGPTAYFRDGFVPFDKANLSIASAPVLYGLSVYTVFPAFWNEREQQLYLFRLEDHFKRLQNSAKIMHFTDFDRNWTYEKFSKMVKQLLKKNKIQEDSLVRVGLFVDESLKGTRAQGLKHSLSAFVYSTPPLLPKSGARLTPYRPVPKLTAVM
jgi:branched-chain amino acid aminotransferase